MVSDKIAEVLGIKFNKDFRVKEKGTVKGDFCFVKGFGLINSTTKQLAPNILVSLVMGRAKFVGYVGVIDVPFQPKVGERYWYIPFPNRTEKSDTYGSIASFNRSLSSNFFRTRAEARAAKDKLYRKYEKYRKACRQYQKEHKKKMGVL